ncbi:MAG: hypothetical protein ABFD80_10790, partial [Acidobacteriota bacterium]
MKKIMILIMAGALAAAGCSSKKEAPMKMAAGTPVYQLAKDAAAVVPALDPDKNPVVVTSKKFDITAGEVLQMVLDSAGTQIQGFKGLDAQRMKTVVERAAVQLGERKLLLTEAAAAKTAVTPDELAKALEAQYAQAGGEAQYAEMLKANGISLDFVKKSVSEEMIIGKYLDVLLKESGKVEEAEIRKAYAEDKTASVR